MSLLDEFVRVDRRHACPVCGRRDWCLVSRDDLDAPSRVICARVESEHRWKSAGWLHRLRDDGWRSSRVRIVHVLDRPRPRPDFDALLADSVAPPQAVQAFAGQLGVYSESLLRLGLARLERQALRAIGFHHADHAWAFPMRDDLESTIGVRLRFPDGSKRAIPGSRAGLIHASLGESIDGRIYVTEGESDAAALLDLGVQAVGRPGCATCTELLVAVVRRRRVGDVVVVADRDQQGLLGARTLAWALRAVAPRVRVLIPPEGTKDARAWRRAGLDRATLEAAVEALPPLPLRGLVSEGV